MSKLKTLTAAGLIALSPLAKANNTDQTKDQTNKDITEILVDSKKETTDQKTISREEAQKIAKDNATKELIKYQISSNIDDLDHFIKHYGKEVVEEKVFDIIDIVSTNPEKYGSFDDKGSFQIDEEKITPLIEETFKEAVGNVTISKFQNYIRIVNSILLIITSGMLVFRKRS